MKINFRHSNILWGIPCFGDSWRHRLIQILQENDGNTIPYIDNSFLQPLKRQNLGLKLHFVIGPHVLDWVQHDFKFKSELCASHGLCKLPSLVPFPLIEEFISVKRTVVFLKRESQTWQILNCCLLEYVDGIPGVAAVSRFDERQSLKCAKV